MLWKLISRVRRLLVLVLLAVGLVGADCTRGDPGVELVELQLERLMLVEQADETLFINVLSKNFEGFWSDFSHM